jgi:hypothetical protein
MTIRSSAFTAQVIVLTCLAFLPQPAQCSVLFENNIRDLLASGPVGLMPGQAASVCAANLDSSPISILIGLMQPSTGALLASKQVQLASGVGDCLNFSSPQTGSNVIGFVVQNGRVNSQGAIVQDRPGGGCIAASVQIQTSNLNNTPGQTFLYVPMQTFH